MLPDEICQQCGATISRRAKANIWNGELVVCTRCLKELEQNERRAVAVIGIAGKPHTPWFVHDGHKQYGPYPTAQLIQLLDGGQVDWLWKIWREGMNAWVAAGQLFVMGELGNGRTELRDFGQGDGTYHPLRR